MARSWSVILARALTTATGRSLCRSRTMAATRSMAFASCTEVPPNFITIMGTPRRKPTTEARRHRGNQDQTLGAQVFPPELRFQRRDKCQGTSLLVPYLAPRIWPLGPGISFHRG